MARRTLNRGDVRWYRFASPDKRRPVLVLGHDSLLRSESAVPVIPFSTQIRGLPWEVVVPAEAGLGVTSVLEPEWIRSVPATDLGPRVCSLPATQWKPVRMAVLTALGLNLSNDTDVP